MSTFIFGFTGEIVGAFSSLVFDRNDFRDWGVLPTLGLAVLQYLFCHSVAFPGHLVFLAFWGCVCNALHGSGS